MWPVRSAFESTDRPADGECTETPDRHGAVMESTPQPGNWSGARGRGLRVELAVVRAIWVQQPRSVSTRERLGGLIERFAARLEATGVTSLLAVTPEHCEGFIWAKTRRQRNPSLATAHLRRSALTGLFAALRQVEPGLVDPTVALSLPSKTERRVRPLSDAEMTRVRVAALGRVRSSRRAALSVALAEASATTGEIAQIQWRDVDLGSGAVDLPGAMPIQPRTGHLSSWGRGVLTRFHHDAQPRPEEFVVPSRVGYADPHSAQAAMANLLTKVLTAAGVTGPGVRPGSLRLWGARQVLVGFGVEAAAEALGVTSLDVARRSLSVEEDL